MPTKLKETTQQIFFSLLLEKYTQKYRSCFNKSFLLEDLYNKEYPRRTRVQFSGWKKSKITGSQYPANGSFEIHGNNSRATEYYHTYILASGESRPKDIETEARIGSQIRREKGVFLVVLVVVFVFVVGVRWPRSLRGACYAFPVKLTGVIEPVIHFLSLSLSLSFSLSFSPLFFFPRSKAKVDINLKKG